MNQLDEIIAALHELPDEERDALVAEAQQATAGMVWVPNPGPQTEAYYSEADVLLYGGEPGGGKSSLILGLALTSHRRSVIMRQQYTDLGHLIEEAIKFNGGRKGFNGSPPPKLKRDDGRLVEFFAAARPGDEQHRQGQPFDFLGVDEATQLAGSQIRFLMGWLRSAEDAGQRKRVVLATNPPLSAQGYWVHEWFAPWIDQRFNNPAKPGELRWGILGDDDRIVWVDGPEPVEYNGKLREPLSYSYIPASLSDNPFLDGTGYEKQIDNLPTEIREAMTGGFRNILRDQEFQIIPTAWISAAQARWTPDGYQGHFMTGMALDPAGGGEDAAELAFRHGGWYGPISTMRGEDTKSGSKTCAMVMESRRNNAVVIVDVGGGYGGAVIERFEDNNITYSRFNGSSASSAKTRDGALGFFNKRSERLWRMREALDPEQEGGSAIALPPDPELLSDLSAATYTVGPKGIKAESKIDIKKRIGRSPGKGDAVVMALGDGQQGVARPQRNTVMGRGPKVVTKRDLRRR